MSIALIASLVNAGLCLLTPTLSTDTLKTKHAPEAARLLSREFCRREPLCRMLGTTEAEILPLFAQLVDHAVEAQLSIVAVNRHGSVVGVVVIEDHRDLFEPHDLALPDGLQAIGAYLERTQLPPELCPEASGELYHCNLTAVAKGYTSRVLSRMILATFKHLNRLGYQRGYAKISNPAVLRNMRKLERFAGKTVFTSAATIRPAEFRFKNRYPFRGYAGITSLITWNMA